MYFYVIISTSVCLRRELNTYCAVLVAGGRGRVGERSQHTRTRRAPWREVLQLQCRVQGTAAVQSMDTCCTQQPLSLVYIVYISLAVTSICPLVRSLG